MEKIGSTSAFIQKRKQPINGNLGILFSDDDVGTTEKMILGSYLDVTRNVAGCQAIRKKIGHILFGFRCVLAKCYSSQYHQTDDTQHKLFWFVLCVSESSVKVFGTCFEGVWEAQGSLEDVFGKCLGGVNGLVEVC